MSSAVIESVHIVPTHDGVAALEVVIKYDNGGRTPIALDEVAADALMNNCCAEDHHQLIGHSWDRVRDALTVSWNRHHGVDGSADQSPMKCLPK